MDPTVPHGSFKTRREMLGQKYEDAVNGAMHGLRGGPYTVSTKPLFSTMLLAFEVVNVDAENQVAFAVARKGTKLDFFSYGIGDTLPLPQDSAASRGKATEADTNISKAKQTNGAADFTIEALSLSPGPFYYEDADSSPQESSQIAFPSQIPSGTNLDPDVARAIQGTVSLADPGSIVLPPQVFSPFNLEDVFFNAVQSRMSLQLLWDEQRVEKLGILRNLAQGGGGSLIRSNGTPECRNVFRIEEGYLWGHVGDGDSGLVVRATLEESVVIPITLNDSPEDDQSVIVPAWIYLGMQLKLHGLEFKYESRN